MKGQDEMTIYAELIKDIDPTADVEAVLDIADEFFRYFGEMSRDEWKFCIEAAK